jgi:hypothetical protein
MAELPRVVWDEANLHHLLVERAERQISCEEVEDVLTDRETVQEEANEEDGWQSAARGAVVL